MVPSSLPPPPPEEEATFFGCGSTEMEFDRVTTGLLVIVLLLFSSDSSTASCRGETVREEEREKSDECLVGSLSSGDWLPPVRYGTLGTTFFGS
jgi:hypothetical protein